MSGGSASAESSPERVRQASLSRQHSETARTKGRSGGESKSEEPGDPPIAKLSEKPSGKTIEKPHEKRKSVIAKHKKGKRKWRPIPEHWLGAGPSNFTAYDASLRTVDESSRIGGQGGGGSGPKVGRVPKREKDLLIQFLFENDGIGISEFPKRYLEKTGETFCFKEWGFDCLTNCLLSLSKHYLILDQEPHITRVFLVENVRKKVAGKLAQRRDSSIELELPTLPSSATPGFPSSSRGRSGKSRSTPDWSSLSASSDADSSLSGKKRRRRRRGRGESVGGSSTAHSVDLEASVGGWSCDDGRGSSKRGRSCYSEWPSDDDAGELMEPLDPAQLKAGSGIFRCGICGAVPRIRPLLSACGHLLCRPCLVRSKKVDRSKRVVICPVCRKTRKYTESVFEVMVPLRRRTKCREVGDLYDLMKRMPVRCLMEQCPWQNKASNKWDLHAPVCPLLKRLREFRARLPSREGTSHHHRTHNAGLHGNFRPSDDAALAVVQPRLRNSWKHGKVGVDSLPLDEDEEEKMLEKQRKLRALEERIEETHKKAVIAIKERRRRVVHEKVEREHREKERERERKEIMKAAAERRWSLSLRDGKTSSSRKHHQRRSESDRSHDSDSDGTVKQRGHHRSPGRGGRGSRVEHKSAKNERRHDRHHHRHSRSRSSSSSSPPHSPFSPVCRPPSLSPTDLTDSAEPPPTSLEVITAEEVERRQQKALRDIEEMRRHVAAEVKRRSKRDGSREKKKKRSHRHKHTQ